MAKLPAFGEAKGYQYFYDVLRKLNSHPTKLTGAQLIADVDASFLKRNFDYLELREVLSTNCDCLVTFFQFKQVAQAFLVSQHYTGPQDLDTDDKYRFEKIWTNYVVTEKTFKKRLSILYHAVVNMIDGTVNGLYDGSLSWGELQLTLDKDTLGSEEEKNLVLQLKDIAQSLDGDADGNVGLDEWLAVWKQLGATNGGSCRITNGEIKRYRDALMMIVARAVPPQREKAAVSFNQYIEKLSRETGDPVDIVDCRLADAGAAAAVGAAQHERLVVDFETYQAGLMIDAIKAEKEIEYGNTLVIEKRI